MNYLTLILTWSALSCLWGVVGIAIGPGIVMLFVGVTIGGSGILFSIAEQLLRFKIRLCYAGLIVSVISLILTFLIFAKMPLTIGVIVFFAVFNAVPSFLIIGFLNSRFSSYRVI